MSLSFGGIHIACAAGRPSRQAALCSLIEAALGPTLPYKFVGTTFLGGRGMSEILQFLDECTLEVIRNLVFVVDLDTLPGPHEWDVSRETHLMCPVQLILSFPEVYWIFVCRSYPNLTTALEAKLPDLSRLADMQSYCKTTNEMVNGHHFVLYGEFSKLLKLLRAHADGFRTLFDPFSFHFFLSLLAQRPNEALYFLRSRSGSKMIPSPGIVAEDEPSFCWFHGYLLYRAMRSVWLAPTLAALKRSVEEVGHHYSNGVAMIEDVELSYSDCPDHKLQELGLMPAGSSVQDVRTALDLRWPSPTWSPRIVISAVEVPPDFTSILKPYGGAFDKQVLELLPITSDWAPAAADPTKGPDPEANRHSATGVVQDIAARTLRRIQAVAAPTDSDRAIHLAALALFSKRLLGGRTIHLSIEATRLQHVCEAEAECLFIGTANDTDVDRRLENIQAEAVELIWRCQDGETPPFGLYRLPLSLRHLRSGRLRLAFSVACAWGARKARKRHQQLANAMLSVVSSLRDVYRRHDRVGDEDDAVRNFLRWQNIQRRQFKGGSIPRYAFAWCSTVPLGYLNVIRRNLTTLFFFSIAWLVLFAGLFALAATWYGGGQISAKGQDRGAPGYWFLQSTATFVGLQQSLESGVTAGSLREDINAIEEWRDTLASATTTRSRPLTPLVTAMANDWSNRLRAQIRVWWFLFVTEAFCGYFHLAVLIAHLGQYLSRR